MSWIKIVRGMSLVLAGCAGTLAFAGGSVVTVTYAPAATANVPTLSEWTLLALAALIAVISYRHLRNRLNGRPLAALFLAGAAGVLALVAGRVGDQALAINLSPMTVQGGGSIPLNCGDSGDLFNNTSVNMKVTSVTSVNPYTVSGTCTNLPTVLPNAACSITVSACPLPQ